LTKLFFEKQNLIIQLYQVPTAAVVSAFRKDVAAM